MDGRGTLPPGGGDLPPSLGKLDAQTWQSRDNSETEALLSNLMIFPAGLVNNFLSEAVSDAG